VRTKKKISQTQLAKELGISQALVSLALNGRSVGINPDTYKRIWERAVSLGYLPKGMRLESTPDSARIKQVGYILRAPLRLYIPSTYFGHVQHGLHQELEARSHRLVFLGAEDELSPEKLRNFFHPSHHLGGVVRSRGRSWRACANSPGVLSPSRPVTPACAIRCWATSPRP